MIKQRSFCLAFLLFIFPFGKNVAQGLSAFLDLKDAFWVFDQSETKRIEQLKPLSYKIGANCMAYTYTDQSFKVYQKGRVLKVNEGFTTDYKMSTDYILMINGTSLYVFDKGTGEHTGRHAVCRRALRDAPGIPPRGLPYAMPANRSTGTSIPLGSTRTRWLALELRRAGTDVFSRERKSSRGSGSMDCTRVPVR